MKKHRETQMELPLDILSSIARWLDHPEEVVALTSVCSHTWRLRKTLYADVKRYHKEHRQLVPLYIRPPNDIYDEDGEWIKQQHNRFPDWVPLAVDLSSCENVKDVSTLGGVDTLDLSFCDHVTDVSKLGGVKHLDLSGCQNVTDVSALGSVETLDLSHCQNVKDVSMLGRVKHLDLSFCANVTDVSKLGGVETLDLSYCRNVTDVSMLGSVKNLFLNGCENYKPVADQGE